MLLEAVIGGLGALVVLLFVFASCLAVVPLVMAIVSILTTFVLLLGLTELTAVSPIVQFLIALIGLGVAIDYSLLVVSRWREERAHGRSGDEAVQRAMESAGRAVVFSGVTVAIGLLALVALPLPFLRSIGLRRDADPARLDARRDHAAPGRAGDSSARGSTGRTGAPTTRPAAPGRAGPRRSRAAAGSSAGAGLLVIVALAAPRSTCSWASRTPRHDREVGQRQDGLDALERSGIGEGALLPHEILIDGSDRPGRRSPPRCARSTASTAPSRPTARVAPRRHRARRCDPGAGRRLGRRRRHARRRARRRPRRRRRRARRRRAGGDRRLHRRGLRQLPADGRADRRHHVHPAGARVPLAAAAAEGDPAQHPQRRRRLGRARARVAARLRLRADLGHRRDRDDPVVDAADDLRLPVRPVDGLRGLHPLAHARGVRPHRAPPRRRWSRASAGPAAWSRAPR